MLKRKKIEITEEYAHDKNSRNCYVLDWMEQPTLLRT